MNETKYLDSKLYVVSNYIAQLLLINFYFVIGTLIGLVVFGVGPSIYASIKLMKEIFEEGHDSHTFTRFMKYYRQHFFKANKIFLSYGAIFLVLGINIHYYDTYLADHVFKIGILMVNYCLLFLVFVSFTSYIGIDIMLNYNVKDKIKASILLPIYYVLDTVIYFIGFVAIFFLLVLFSQFISFLCFSVYCYFNYRYVSKLTTKFTLLMETKSANG